MRLLPSILLTTNQVESHPSDQEGSCFQSTNNIINCKSDHGIVRFRKFNEAMPSHSFGSCTLADDDENDTKSVGSYNCNITNNRLIKNHFEPDQPFCNSDTEACSLYTLLFHWLQDTNSHTDDTGFLEIIQDSVCQQWSTLEQNMSLHTNEIMNYISSETTPFTEEKTDSTILTKTLDDGWAASVPALLRVKDGNILLARIEFQYGPCPEQVYWTFLEVPPLEASDENDISAETVHSNSTITLLQHDMWSMWNPYYARTTDYILLQPQAAYVLEIIDAYGSGLPGGFVRITLHKNVETAATTLVYREFNECNDSSSRRIFISFTTNEY